MINYSIRRLKDVRSSVMRSHFMHQRSKNWILWDLFRLYLKLYCCI